jgi:hypothetical protein
LLLHVARALGQHRLAAALLLAGLGVLAAGCGGGGKKPSVASLGPTTAATTTTGGGSSGGPARSNTAALVKFQHCMQAHGVQVNVQTGNGGKNISIGVGGPGSAGPSPALMQKAQEACQKLLPGGGPKPATPAQQAEQRQNMLKLAQCMRKHGFPNFPDPDSQGGLDLNASNIDPGSSRFQTAMQACSPGGKGFVRISTPVPKP